MDYEGYTAALAHNVKKMVRKLARGVGPPGPASPDAGTVAGAEYAMADAVTNSTTPLRCFPLINWLFVSLRPEMRYTRCRNSSESRGNEQLTAGGERI